MERRTPRRRVGAAARKLISLDRGEWRDLLRAQWTLIGAQRYVRTQPAGQLTARRDDNPPATNVSADGSVTTRARQIGRAIQRAAKYGAFRPACLVQAIALQRMLERDGIDGSMIRVGVRQADEGMLAHAWVEWRGEIIGDSPENVRQYAPLDELSVTP
jgi:hypothetical protein